MLKELILILKQLIFISCVVYLGAMPINAQNKIENNEEAYEVLLNSKVKIETLNNQIVIGEFSKHTQDKLYIIDTDGMVVQVLKTNVRNILKLTNTPKGNEANPNSSSFFYRIGSGIMTGFDKEVLKEPGVGFNIIGINIGATLAEKHIISLGVNLPFIQYQMPFPIVNKNIAKLEQIDFKIIPYIPISGCYQYQFNSTIDNSFYIGGELSYNVGVENNIEVVIEYDNDSFTQTIPIKADSQLGVGLLLGYRLKLSSNLFLSPELCWKKINDGFSYFGINLNIGS